MSLLVGQSLTSSSSSSSSLPNTLYTLIHTLQPHYLFFFFFLFLLLLPLLLLLLHALILVCAFAKNHANLTTMNEQVQLMRRRRKLRRLKIICINGNLKREICGFLQYSSYAAKIFIGFSQFRTQVCTRD